MDRERSPALLAPKAPLWRQKQEAQILGKKALLVGAGSTLAALGLGFLSPTLGLLAGLAGLGTTAVYAWRWLQYRAKWGLRL